MLETTKSSLPPAHRSLSRRDALLTALAGSFVLVSWPNITISTEIHIGSDPTSLAPFVPENDYPFFGYEP